MKVLTRATGLLVIGAAALLAGCSSPTAGQSQASGQPGSAGGHSTAAAQSPATGQSPNQPDGSNPAGPQPGAPQSQSEGYLQLGHLAPNAPSFDGYFARFGQDGKLVGSGGYGNIGPYMALPPGRYVWSMRPTDSPPNSPLTLTKLIEVKPGQTTSVVLFNTGAKGALQGVVIPEDATPPTGAMAKVRIVEGADGPPLSLTVGNAAAQQLTYGTITPYQVVPSGQLTVKTDAANTAPLTTTLAPGSLTTVLVTRTAQGGVQLAPVTDKIATSPLGSSAPTGVNTGDGGLAGSAAAPPLLLGGLAGAGLLLMALGAGGALRRRRST